MLKYEYLQTHAWSCGAAALMCGAAELGVGDLLDLGNSKANLALVNRFPGRINLSNIFKNLYAPIKETAARPSSAGPAPAGPASAGPAPAGPASAGPASAGPASAGGASMGSTYSSSPPGLPMHIAAPAPHHHPLSEISLEPPYSEIPPGLQPFQICSYIENTIFIATRTRNKATCPSGSWVSGIAYTASAMGLNVDGIYLTPKIAEIERSGQPPDSFGLFDYMEEKEYLEKKFTLFQIQHGKDFPHFRENSRRFMLVAFEASNGLGLHWIMQRSDNSFMNPGRSMPKTPLHLQHPLVSHNPIPQIFQENHNIILGIQVSSRS